VRPGLYRVLDALRDIPALITGRRLDILAGNRMAHALLTDFGALPHHERNMARYVFLDPAARTLYDDWAAAARSVVAILRVDAGRHPIAGNLILDYEIFSPAEDEDQRLVLHTAEPGSPSEQGLHQLACSATAPSCPPLQNSAVLDG
jgi:MmyB-like transcription regulator ligand binding domain